MFLNGLAMMDWASLGKSSFAVGLCRKIGPIALDESLMMLWLATVVDLSIEDRFCKSLPLGNIDLVNPNYWFAVKEDC